MSPRWTVLRFPALVVVALATTAACGASGADEGPADPVLTPTEVYVAVGADETVGVGAERPLVEAWPRELFRSLDPGATFVNAAAEHSTVADAFDEQLPIVRELEPTLVTVWLNVNDLAAGVTPATYEDQLGELVRELRQDGRARVLVANTPPVDQFPSYPEVAGMFAASRDEVAAMVDAYNGAVAAVAAREGAEVVDVNAALSEAIADGTLESLIGDDGTNPNTAGHVRIAEIFADVVAR